MAKVTPISEHIQHFLTERRETFWGDLYGQTKLAAVLRTAVGAAARPLFWGRAVRTAAGAAAGLSQRLL
jgi:hypothetical protein